MLCNTCFLYNNTTETQSLDIQLYGDDYMEMVKEIIYFCNQYFKSAVSH